MGGFYIRRNLSAATQTELEAHYLFGLHRYLQYGLEMRRLLEHLGPYEISREIANNRIASDLMHIGSIKKKEELNSHQATYLRLTADTLVVSTISLFEYLISNVLIELYELSEQSLGEIGNELFLVWDENDKNEYFQYCKDNDVGSDKWRFENHSWEEQKSRLKKIESMLGFKIQNIKYKDSTFGWDNFCSMRTRRIEIVHSTKRESLFKAREKGDTTIALKNALDTLNWVLALNNAIKNGIYSTPILRDDMAGKKAYSFDPNESTA